MRRIFLLFLISITSFYVLLNPQTTFAAPFTGPPASCTDRGIGRVTEVSFEKQLTIGQRVRVSVTFDATKTDRTWNFFIKVPVGVNQDLESPSISLAGNTPASTNGNLVTYNFETRTAINNYRDSYEIQLDHSEGAGSEQVCQVGTFSIIDTDLDNAQCSVVTPKNVQAGTAFNISTSVTAFPAGSYPIYIYRQSDAPNPGPAGQTLKTPSVDQYNNSINRNRTVYFGGVTPPSQVINYTNNGTRGFPRLDTGTNYSVFIIPNKAVQSTPGNVEIFYKYCRFDFTVNNNPTTPSFKVNGQDKVDAVKGTTVTLGWSAFNDATINTWIGSFKPGDDDTKFINAIYTSTCGLTAGGLARPDGTCPFTVPNEIGEYEFRMFKTGANDLMVPDIRPKVNVTDVPAGPPPGGGSACTDPATCSKGSGIPCGGDGIETALGCLHTDTKSLINSIMKLAAGLAGAVTLILMIIGAAQMLTSGGNPEQIKKGRDQFVSAVVGLLFIIFSVTLLQIIGVDILNIPGFSK